MRASADVADFWSEPVNFGRTTVVARRTAPAAMDYPAGDEYDDYEFGDRAAAADWTPVPDERSWREWEDWQGRVAPPLMHPDHPSAPVPLVRFPGWQEPVRHHRDAGPLLRDPGPAGPRFGNGRDPARDSWPGQALVGRQAAQQAQDQAAQILESAEFEAAAITEQATGEAAAIREGAERQAAAIREAAELEAAEARARLDSMWSELGRVAAYVTETLGTPGRSALPGAEPAFADAAPALPGAPATIPGAASALPGPTSALPVTRPPRPASRTARQEKPESRPDRHARPSATPAKNPQRRPRQQRAMRAATYATAGLVAFATLAGATEVGLHGFKFFVFREGGQGQSTDNHATDKRFLAQQAAAARHAAAAPKGRHHKTSPQTAGRTVKS